MEEEPKDYDVIYLTTAVCTPYLNKLCVSV